MGKRVNILLRGNKEPVWQRNLQRHRSALQSNWKKDVKTGDSARHDVQAVIHKNKKNEKVGKEDFLWKKNWIWN